MTEKTLNGILDMLKNRLMIKASTYSWKAVKDDYDKEVGYFYLGLDMFPSGKVKLKIGKYGIVFYEEKADFKGQKSILLLNYLLDLYLDECGYRGLLILKNNRLA
jgi:hypothetical protein